MGNSRNTNQKYYDSHTSSKAKHKTVYTLKQRIIWKHNKCYQGDFPVPLTLRTERTNHSGQRLAGRASHEPIGTIS